ncbi:DUF962 domain-containing protein [Paraburkholderia sp. J76]|uniref:Mpo1 family 2-hydroxy fatty acid dioxygenase n=1 Tax=Paraburkholderia sp. J76 TaxID=2805439 RepID=UPI002ABE037B|nr:Mpo1-like protein [Paraburkholderia sp. J76]
MSNLTEQLTQYAAYHRDARNIGTHFVGIPLIVLALAVLLSRPAIALNALGFAVPLSPAWLLFGAATIYYLVLDVPLGLMMAVVSVACVAFGAWLAQQGTAAWLVSGVALFVIGWIFQFVGHVAWEHRKPAFVDDLIGLVIGPLFVLAEALFSIGWRPALRADIEAKVGPTRINPPRAQEARQ